MEKKRIYLDYAATTPVEPRVLEAMLPYFFESFGNPSSIHSYGQRAETALENSRAIVAEALNCQVNEILFTSGGTESNNLALRGVALARRQQRGANHILTTPVEHPAVLNTVRQLADIHGFEVELLAVDRFGRVDLEDVASRIRSDTALVSIIYANNEIGTINPIHEISRICKHKGIPLHSDAVQAVAYLPINLQELQVDLLSIGAHKFYGPKGVGILFVRKETPLVPVQTGGSQEFGLRAGTSNIPYIVGLAAALRIAVEERQQRTDHVMPLRDRLISQILEQIPDCQLIGHPVLRLPNHASIVFRHVDGNSLLMLLDSHGFACSSGSACKVGNPEPSDVLLALGLEKEWALGSLRITLGNGTTVEQINEFTRFLPQAISEARKFHSYTVA